MPHAPTATKGGKKSPKIREPIALALDPAPSKRAFI